MARTKKRTKRSHLRFFKGTVFRRKDRGGRLFLRWTDAAGVSHVQAAESQDPAEARRELVRLSGAEAPAASGVTLFVKYVENGRTVLRAATVKDRLKIESALARLTGATPPVEDGDAGVTARDFVLSTYLPTLRTRVVPEHADGVASHLLGPLTGEPKSKKETPAERDARRKGGFCDFLGNLPLHACGPDKVELFIATLRNGEDPVSPATCSRFRASISGMFRAAVDSRIAKENPARVAKLPKVQQYEPHAMTPEDVDRVIARVPEHARAPFVLLADLGLRLGELLALEWRHVAADDSEIVVARSKSGKTRVVPVPPRSRTVLAALRAERVAPMAGPDLVMRRPRSPSRLQRLFRDAAKKAGLPVVPDSPVGVRIHDIRHAYASALARNGVALSVVAHLIGDSLAVTSSRYARHVPKSEAVRAVESLSARASTGPQSAPASA